MTQPVWRGLRHRCQPILAASGSGRACCDGAHRRAADPVSDRGELHGRDRRRIASALDHYRYVFDLSGWRLWRVSLIYAAGSSCFAIVVGVSSAWLVARTNAYFRRSAVIGAYLSLAAPVMVKAIGWILLLGPNKGVINEWLRALFASRGRADRAVHAERHDAARRSPLGAGRLPADAAGVERDGPCARRGRRHVGRDVVADACAGDAAARVCRASSRCCC